MSWIADGRSWRRQHSCRKEDFGNTKENHQLVHYSSLKQLDRLQVTGFFLNIGFKEKKKFVIMYEKMKRVWC